MVGWLMNGEGFGKMWLWLNQGIWHLPLGTEEDNERPLLV
jgi:hypothetical protein